MFHGGHVEKKRLHQELVVSENTSTFSRYLLGLTNYTRHIVPTSESFHLRLRCIGSTVRHSCHRWDLKKCSRFGEGKVISISRISCSQPKTISAGPSHEQEAKSMHSGYSNRREKPRSRGFPCFSHSGVHEINQKSTRRAVAPRWCTGPTVALWVWGTGVI